MLTVIITVVMFLALITVHEFGHFIMAKLTGIKVEEFAVGMGPCILKKWGHKTLYSLRLIPIGGYCRFADEDGKNPDALSKQKKYKRFLVLISGALLNVVLGYILFVVLTLSMPVGEGEVNKISVPVVDSVVENSYVSDSGLMAGDRILEIDGHKIRFYQDISLYTSNFNENTVSDMIVKRNNEKVNILFKPTVSESTYNYKEDYIEVVTSVNGVETIQNHEYSTNVDPSQIKEMAGKTETEKRLIIGFVPKTEPVGLNNIFSYSFHYTGYVVRMVYKSIWDLLTGAVGFEAVSGPVGIASVVNEAVNTGSYGFVNILFLAAVITINLGIFNLLPLPALDGGRLVFLIIEFLRGKPVSVEREETIHTIGLILLMILGIFIAFSDVFKLIR